MLCSSRRLNTFRLIKFRGGPSRLERLDGIEMSMQAGISTAAVLNLAYPLEAFD